MIDLWAMNFYIIKNEVLAFDSESINEVFIWHADLTALNPIWRFEEPITEFTALLTCLLLIWHIIILISLSRILWMRTIDMIYYSANKSLSCLPLVLILLTVSRLSSELFWIRACNNNVLVRRLKCSLNFG